ncbi:MAG: Hsp20/alpha crystallin family protein [Planctomycetes bacterium]|nr:Hsp20/alpha crystallin family protein [Planctomycetota bacterium]
MAGFFLNISEGSQGFCWQPPVDVYRTPYGWVIKVELSGVRPGEIAIEREGSSLTVRGIRRDFVLEEGWSHHSMEISYSQFERTIQLPCNLLQARLSTDYREGMLLIHVDVEEEAS